MHRGIIVASLACFLFASAWAVDEVLGRLRIPGKNGEDLAIPREVIGDSGSELARRVKSWCDTTGECADFKVPHSVSKRSATVVGDMCRLYGVECKRAATVVGDLCKLYGVKCKRGAAISGEDEFANMIVKSFVDYCDETGDCNFLSFLQRLNSQVRALM